MHAMILQAIGQPLEWTELPGRMPDSGQIRLKASACGVRKGGRVVCAGIHMSDIPRFPYRLLWEERDLVSVANLTRPDGLDFLKLAPTIGIVTTIHRYPLQRANEALDHLRAGRFDDAAVLIPGARESVSASRAPRP